MKKIVNVRHGDMALLWVSELPKWLKQSKTNIMMVWSHGNNHAIDTGKLYITTPIEQLKEWEFIFWYLVAKWTTLLHKDHWVWKWEIKKCKIPDGIYELRKQVEILNEGMKPVVD